MAIAELSMLVEPTTKVESLTTPGTAEESEESVMMGVAVEPAVTTTLVVTGGGRCGQQRAARCRVERQRGGNCHRRLRRFRG
jgi:hypothetical protein